MDEEQALAEIISYIVEHGPFVLKIYNRERDKWFFGSNLIEKMTMTTYQNPQNSTTYPISQKFAAWSSPITKFEFITRSMNVRDFLRGLKRIEIVQPGGDVIAKYKVKLGEVDYKQAPHEEPKFTIKLISG